jgi:YcxB-like protein
MAIVVEFEATRADMSAFQRFVTGRIRQSVRSPVYWLVLALLGVIVGGLLSGALGVRFHRPTALVVLLLGVGFWWIIAKLYRSAATPLRHGSLVGARRVELSDEHIRQVAALHDARTRWEGVLSVDETPTHVFLMTDRLAGYIVPRRAFADPAQYAAFVAFARGRLERLLK